MTDAKVTIEKKVNIALIALESLIVNDKNLEMAVEANILNMLVKLIRGLPVRVGGGIPT